MDAETRLARIANALEERAEEYPGLVVCEPVRLPTERATHLHVYLTTPGGGELPRSELVLELELEEAYREEVFRSADGTRTEEYWDPVRFDLATGYRLAVPRGGAVSRGQVTGDLEDFEGPEEAADALVAYLESGLAEADAEDEPN